MEFNQVQPKQFAENTFVLQKSVALLLNYFKRFNFFPKKKAIPIQKDPLTVFNILLLMLFKVRKCTL